MNAWMLLTCAIAIEVIGTLLLKLSNGFENTFYGVVSIICFCLCFVILAPVMKSLPVGLVYAIWSGVGIVAASLIGVVLFKETLNLSQVLFIGLILVGTVGLKFSTGN